MSAATSDGPRHRNVRRFKPDRDVEEWHGAYVPYDIVKEFLIAFLVVLVVVVGLAIVFSSPDERPVTVKSWSTANPVDFAQTAITELDGTSGTATYGPPYNNGNPQSIGPFSPANWLGVTHPIDTANDFVIQPLRTLPDRPDLDAAISDYTSATADQQQKWTAAYEKAIGSTEAAFANGTIHLPASGYGPVGPMIAGLTSMARSGALDGALVSTRQFYGTDYTKPLLFIADGTYLADLAQSQHLSGDQWGMMNETGNYPGQAWLWLYTLWYQVPPMNTSSNADLQVWAIMMLLTLGLVLLPFIPGLRSIPRWTRVYRLIWRRHYRELASAPAGPNRSPPAGPTPSSSTTATA